MSKLRKNLSKEYWQTIKNIMKRKKKATIAISFKEEEGKDPDFENYIKKLFEKT